MISSHSHQSGFDRLRKEQRTEEIMCCECEGDKSRGMQRCQDCMCGCAAFVPVRSKQPGSLAGLLPTGLNGAEPSVAAVGLQP